MNESQKIEDFRNFDILGKLKDELGNDLLDENGAFQFIPESKRAKAFSRLDADKLYVLAKEHLNRGGLYEDILDFMVLAICNKTELGKLKIIENAIHEVDDGFFAGFMLQRVISNEYITTFTPAIINEKFKILVDTSKCIDKMGAQSIDFKNVYLEMSERNEFNKTIGQIVNRAVIVARTHQRDLLEAAGLPRSFANRVAMDRRW